MLKKIKALESLIEKPVYVYVFMFLTMMIVIEKKFVLKENRDDLLYPDDMQHKS